MDRIERETQHAREGKPARILAKMNSLSDPGVIRALYGASQAGVQIDLVVRGICCLRPGLPGVSDNIRVVSVVDRFLEHSRVFAFGVGDRTEVLMSSADWMQRNFVRRIEVMVPVDDPQLKARLLDEVIGYALRDNVKARRLLPDGQTALVSADDGAAEAPFQSQVQHLEAARRAAEQRAPEIRQVAAPEPVPLVEPRAGSAA